MSYVVFAFYIIYCVALLRNYTGVHWHPMRNLLCHFDGKYVLYCTMSCRGLAELGEVSATLDF